jgi:hypothetical protein
VENCEKTKRVVRHCADAIREIETEMPQPTGDKWERRWASLLSLLRTATLRLEADAPLYWNKYMRQPNAVHKKERDPKRHWAPDIFGKFIWRDSNLFLHQGGTAEDESIMPHLPSAMMAVVQGASTALLKAEEPLRVSYHIKDPPYEGRDALEVAKEAVAWLNARIVIAEA